MTKYTLYIGLNDKDSRKQEIKTGRALDIVTAALLPCGGATISEARGIYTHDDGGTVEEPTIRAEILDFSGDALQHIRAAAAELKQALNQESIALQVEQVEAILL